MFDDFERLLRKRNVTFPCQFNSEGWSTYLRNIQNQICFDLTLLLPGGGAQGARGADYLMQCCQFERYRAETW